jgi:hypothetical protein
MQKSDQIIAIDIARHKLARKGSIQASDDDDCCPIAIDEDTPDGRVISAETDDMKQKQRELKYAAMKEAEMKLLEKK